MSTFETVLLVLLVLVLAMNLVALVWMWLRQDSLGTRVARLEEWRSMAPTTAELHEIGLRLAAMNGQLMTAVQLMRSIQEHLLDREREGN